MSRSFKNVTDFLAGIGYKLKESKEEYIEAWKKDIRNFRFTYVCPKEHETETSLAIFNNSKVQLKKGTRKQLCSTCNGKKGVKHNYGFDFHEKKIFELTGHKVISIEKDRICSYICGTCGEKVKSTVPNLEGKKSKLCWKCRNFNTFRSVRKNFTKKIYKMPSGKKVKVMGYEPLCLDRLLQTNHPYLKRPLQEKEIFLNSQVPKFPYTDRLDKKRIYYPDILIKTEDPYNPDKKYKCIIEVKSTWTFNQDTETNFEKWKAVAEAGYNMKIYLYGNQGLIDIWTFFENMKKPPRSMSKKVINFDTPVVFKKGVLSQEDRECIALEEFFKTLEI